MEPKCLKWLDDVWQAAELIQQVTNGITEAGYLRDRFLRCGVERNFEIIGEALNRIRKADPTLAAQIPDSDKIVAFRNLVIHGYDMIRDSDVWRIIQSNLPSLTQVVAGLIDEERRQGESPLTPKASP
ncbi:MAG: hypothetical protein FD138_1087 [Planctomycetota bacterium]|nr:MAG: hypothetical protein FD138_1087 [Planctomycetota bacterium]